VSDKPEPSPSWPSDWTGGRGVGLGAETLLQVHLALAVPIWIRHYADFAISDSQRRSRAAELAIFIAEHGDNVLYQGAKPGETADAFNRLAEAIAIAAYQPGGVTIFGQHWNANR